MNYPNSPLYEEAFMNLLRKAKDKRDFFRILKKKRKRFLLKRELEILYLKSIFYRKEKNIKKAEKIERILLRKYPYSEFSRKIAKKGRGRLKDIIRVLYLHGEWEKIIEILNKRKIYGSDLIFYKAYSYFKLKDYPKALFYFKKYLRINGKYRERVNFYKGILYLYLGDTLKAINSFVRNLIYQNSFKEHSIRELRLIYLSSKKYRKKIKKIIENLEPSKEVVYFYYDIGEKEKAIKLGSKIKTIDPVFNFLMFNLTKNSSYFENIKKEYPLSYFALKKDGIVFKKSLYFDTTYIPLYDTLTLLLEFNLEDDVLKRVNKIDDIKKLIGISIFFKNQKKYNFSVKVARRIYQKLRLNNENFGDSIFLKLLYPLPYFELVDSVSKKYNLPSHLIYAIMRRESLFDTLALSPKGAKGIMQLMEKTFLKFSKDSSLNIFNIKNNIETGVKYLRALIDTFGLFYGIAAYNAGENKIKEWKKFIPEDSLSIFFDIPYRETRKYLFLVLSDYYVYKLLYPLKLKNGKNVNP